MEQWLPKPGLILEKLLRGCVGSRGGRIVVTNSASGHARLMETIPLFSASYVPRTELN
jgi:hypothetical protein